MKLIPSEMKALKHFGLQQSHIQKKKELQARQSEEIVSSVSQSAKDTVKRDTERLQADKWGRIQII